MSVPGTYNTFMASAVVNPYGLVGIGSRFAQSGSFTPDVHVNTQIGDFVILACEVDGDETISTPSGWTGLSATDGGSGVKGQVFYRVYAGSMPTISNGDKIICQSLTFGGINATPLDNTPTTSFVSLSGPTYTTGAFTNPTTVTNNAFVLTFIFHDVNTSSAAVNSWSNASLTSASEIVDISTTIGSRGGVGVYGGYKTTAGSIANTGFVLSGASPNVAGIRFALRPA